MTGRTDRAADAAALTRMVRQGEREGRQTDGRREREGDKCVVREMARLDFERTPAGRRPIGISLREENAMGPTKRVITFQ